MNDPVSQDSSPAKQIHAFVLSGSGADGAYQVGVLKALFGGESPAWGNVPIEPSVLAGTSTGVFNACLLASHWDDHGARSIDKLEHVWRERLSWTRFVDGGFRIRLNLFDLLKPGAWAPGPGSAITRLFADLQDLSREVISRVSQIGPGDFAARLADLMDFGLLLGTETLSAIIADSIDFGKLGSSPLRLTVATTNWDNGEVCHTANCGGAHSISPRLVLAATAVPGYYTPEKVNDQMHVDAECEVLAPLGAAIRQLREVAASQAGEEELHVHVIYVCAKKNEMPAAALGSILQTHYGSQVISWTSRIDQDLQRAHRINQGIVLIEDLAALERHEVTGSQEPETEAIRRMRARLASMHVRERQGLLATASEVVRRLQVGEEWKKLTIHRHFPSQGLDSKLGFLDFRRSRVEGLMAQGFVDAARHDCGVNRCIRIEQGRASNGAAKHAGMRAAEHPRPLRQAMIFSGGGAYGAYQVGCAKALFGGQSPSTAGEPLKPDVFAGTSVGAFNASFLVSKWQDDGMTAVKDLEAAWRERIAWKNGVNGTFRMRLTPLELLFPEGFLSKDVWPRAFRNLNSDAIHLLKDMATRGLNLLKFDEPFLQRLSATLDLSAFVAPEPWEETIRALVDFDRIRKSSRRLTIAATNWPRGTVSHFGNRNISPEAIRASSAIPGFYSPAKVGDQICVDGAVLMNTPLKPAIGELQAIDSGCGAAEFVLHVVYINPHVEKSATAQGTVHTLFRSQAIQWGAAVEADIASARMLNAGLSFVINRLIAYGEQPGTELAGAEMEAVREAVASRPGGEAQALFETAERIMRKRELGEPYQQLTIHRYFPRQPISGAASLLDVRGTTIDKLIRQGFEDTVAHNCEESGCVLAQRQAVSAAAAA